MSPADLYARGLLIDPDSPNPSRELLKPMALHYRMLDSKDMGTFVVLIERLKSDQSRPTGAAHFQKALDLYSVEKWTAFSRSLASAGALGDALQALENAQQLLTIHPHYGFPEVRPKPHNFDVARELFCEVSQLLSEGVGDQLDRAVVEYQCAYDWRAELAKGEEEEEAKEEEEED